VDWEKVRGDLVGPHNVVATPFLSGTEIDEAGLRKLVRRMVDGGYVRGRGVLIPNGSGSECYAMRLDEQKRVIEIVADEAGGRVPIVPGASETGADKVIELAAHAAACGAEAIMLLPPYYVTPSDEVTYRHFAAVAEAVDIGIMIYDSKHVKDMSLDLLERLAEIPNVVAIKANDPSVFRLMQTIDQFGDRWSVVSGMGELYFPFQYKIGADGYTTGTGNFAPEITIEMYEAVLAGEWDRCYQLRERALPAMNCVMQLSEGPSFKVPAVLAGILDDAGAYRLPSLPPTDEQVEAFRQALEHLTLEPVGD
jgi:4-hydroxy-tetrahydrodipicolinate synthase